MGLRNIFSVVFFLYVSPKRNKRRPAIDDGPIVGNSHVGQQYIVASALSILHLSDHHKGNFASSQHVYNLLLRNKYRYYFIKLYRIKCRVYFVQQLSNAVPPIGG